MVAWQIRAGRAFRSVLMAAGVVALVAAAFGGGSASAV